MADWLSMCRAVGELVSWPSSPSKRLNQTASFAACALARYSASVLERATAACFFELQLITAPPNMKTKPEVDLRSLTSLAQSASMKLCKTVLLGVPCWKMSCRLLVALRYWNVQSSVHWWSVPGLAACCPSAVTV